MKIKGRVKAIVLVMILDYKIISQKSTIVVNLFVLK